MSSLEPMCEGEKDEKGETERHRDRHRKRDRDGGGERQGTKLET